LTRINKPILKQRFRERFCRGTIHSRNDGYGPAWLRHDFLFATILFWCSSVTLSIKWLSSQQF